MLERADALDRLWAILDLAEPLVCAQQTLWWPPGDLDALVAAGLLAPTTAAAQAECPACAERHVEEVELDRRPDGTVRYLVPCPEAGRAEVEPTLLRQWRPDFQALAKALRELMGIDGRA